MAYATNLRNFLCCAMVILSNLAFADSLETGGDQNDENVNGHLISFPFFVDIKRELLNPKGLKENLDVYDAEKRHLSSNIYSRGIGKVKLDKFTFSGGIGKRYSPFIGMEGNADNRQKFDKIKFDFDDEKGQIDRFPSNLEIDTTELDPYGFAGKIGKRRLDKFGFSGGIGKRRVDRFGFSGGIGKRQKIDRFSFAGGVGKRRIDRFGFSGGIGKRQKIDRFSFAGGVGKRRIDRFGFSGGIGKRQKIDRFSFAGGVGKRRIDRFGFSGGIGKRFIDPLDYSEVPEKRKSRLDRIGFSESIGKRSKDGLVTDEGFRYYSLNPIEEDLEKREAIEAFLSGDRDLAEIEAGEASSEIERNVEKRSAQEHKETAKTS